MSPLYTSTYEPLDDSEFVYENKTANIDKYQERVDQGCIYNPQGYAMRTEGIAVVRPVVDVYSGAVLAPLLFVNPFYSKEFTKDLLMAMVAQVPLAVSAVLSAIAQIGALWYVAGLVNQMKADTDEPCKEGSHILRLICVTVFVSSIVHDVGQSCQFFNYIWNLPAWRKPDSESDALDLSRQYRMLQSALGVRSKVVENENGWQFRVNEVAFGGVTLRHRLLMFCVATFKITLEMAVFFFGSGYVALATTDEDLLLNAVALTFILQIDDAIFESTTQDFTMRMLNAMPTMGRLHTTSDLAIALISPWATLVFIGMLTAGGYYQWCH